MVPLLFCQVAKQLPDSNIRGASRGGFIESLRFQLHQFRGLLHRSQAQRPHQPDRPTAHEPAHVLAPDQRHMLAEPAAVELQQPMPMRIFITPHFGKFLRLLRVVLLQAIGEIIVDSRILLLL